MPFALRVWCISLVLSVSLVSPVLAQPQSSASVPNISPASAESALRAVAEKYFALYTAKDLDGLMALWSATSPELEGRKKSTLELFASSEKISRKSFAVRRVSVVGDKARVRVEVDLQVIEAKTGKEKAGYGKLLRTLECVREASGWKVVKEVATYDELADILLSAKTDEERAVLPGLKRN
jgi:hypothetical protein